MSTRLMLGWIIGCVCAVVCLNWFVDFSPSVTNNPQGETMVKTDEARQGTDVQVETDETHRSADDQVEADEASQLIQDLRAEDQWRERLATARGVAYLTLDNQSGMDVLVKVIRAENLDSYMTVQVQDNSCEEVTCPAETLFLKMRYQAPGGFQYQQGNRFDLRSNSRAKITLHKVVNGNYGSRAIGQAEF